MPEDLLTMSAKEIDRAGLIRRVLEGRLPQKVETTARKRGVSTARSAVA